MSKQDKSVVVENMEDGEIDGTMLGVAYNFADEVCGGRFFMIRFRGFWKVKFGFYPESEKEILKLPEGRSMDIAIRAAIDSYLAENGVLKIWAQDMHLATFEVKPRREDPKRTFLNIELPWCEKPDCRLI